MVIKENYRTLAFMKRFLKTLFAILLINLLVKCEADTTNGSRLSNFVGISLDDCLVKCKKHMSCRSFTYNRRATSCQLYTDFIMEYKGQKVKGVEYADLDTRPEMTHSTLCNGHYCTSDQTCDEVCTTTQCETPASFSGTTIFGNRRTIGSRIMYTCKHSNSTRSSICQTNGTWSLEDFLCERLGFTIYTDDHFMKSLSAGIHYNGQITFDDVTRDECLMKCKDNTDFCIAFNYNPASRSCVLTELQMNANTMNDKFIESRLGWEIYHKVVPVAFYGNFMQYETTFQQAVQYCKSIGTTIASHADVLQAYNLGYNLCNCAWVAEGYAVISLHYYFNTCYKNRKGLFSCWKSTHFNMYCKNPDY